MFRGKAVGGPARALDAAECRKALEILADNNAGIELRALPAGRSTVLHGADLDGLVDAADAYCLDGQQVYYCLNPIPPDLNHAARKDDPISRRWLLIDVDPVKGELHKNDSATDDEKAAAWRVAEAVISHLSALGWPAPVIVDTGNGFHLLYRLDLPNDAITHAAIKRLLYTLADQFDTEEARIDIAVHNPSRIAKLPGSWAMKGPDTAERPWRRCKIISVPACLFTVEIERVIIAGGVQPKPELADKSKTKLKGKATSNEKAYGQAALLQEAGRVTQAKDGERNNALNRAAFSLGQLVAGGVLDKRDVINTLERAAEQAGLYDDPNCGERGVAATIASGMEAGKLEPRRNPEEKEQPKSAAESIPEGDTCIEWASDVKPVKVEWLWKDRIPLGKLTTFAGMTSVGKTFTLLDISSRVSRGGDWPDSNGECCEAGKVLFISAEDAPDDTLVPRLIEMGADRSRIAFLKAKHRDKYTLADLPLLDRALKDMGNTVKLICIDPPTAYVGKVDDHKNAELRGILRPLADWAEKYHVAIVFITHFNKSSEKVQALQKVMGSVAWVNAVRAAHMFAKDPEDDERRLFLPLKMNLCKEPKGLAYQVVASGELAKVKWLGEVDIKADDAANRDSGKKKRKVVATEWLAGKFSNTVEIESDLIWKAKDEETTLSRNALLEAKSELRVEAKKRYDQDNGREFWVWTWSPEDKIRWRARQDAAKEKAVPDDEQEI